MRSVQKQTPRNFFFYSPNREEVAHYFHAALDLGNPAEGTRNLTVKRCLDLLFMGK